MHVRQPETDGIVGTVRVSVEGDVKLDRRRREAFKPVFASSMHVSDELWDVESIRIDSRRFAIPEWGVDRRWNSAKGRRIILNGGSSGWKRRAPSLEIELDDCMETAGWKLPALIRTTTTSASGLRRPCDAQVALCDQGEDVMNSVPNQAVMSGTQMTSNFLLAEYRELRGRSSAPRCSIS